MTAVLALMAVLAAIVTLSVRPLMAKGKQNAARSQVAHLCSALESYYTLHGRYPTEEEGLVVLTQKSDKLPEGLLQQVPTDPWGHAFQYNTPGRNGEPYEIVCFGADGREGGSGADADIYSWSLKDGQDKGAGGSAQR